MEMPLAATNSPSTKSTTQRQAADALDVTAFVISSATLPDMPIVFASPAFESLTGYTFDEIIGRSCRFLQGSDRSQTGLIELRAALKEKRACRTVLRNYRKDGSAFWNDFSLTPILNGAGEATHFIGVQNIIKQEDLLHTLVNASNALLGASKDGKQPPTRLGDILVELGLVSQATIAAAVQMQKDGYKKNIGEILVEHFGVNHEAVLKALSKQVEKIRLEQARTEALEKRTAFAVRLAQKAMEAVPESDLPIFSICEPLMDAGGDTFYRVLLPDKTHLLILADVAGHSVMSSYAVASFLGIVCALSRNFSGLRRLFTEINSCLQSGPFGDLPICVFAAHWNIRTGRLHLMNAAVPHSIVFRTHTRTSHAVALDGNPLGILDEPQFSERVLMLCPGDRLVFGSDGVFEAPSEDETMFEDVAAEHWTHQTQHPLGDALVGFCEAFRQHTGSNLKDDVLVVAIEQPPLRLSPLEEIITFHSTFDGVDEACLRLVEFVEGRPELRGQTEDWHFGLLLVAREALTNAVVHGNKEESSKLVCLHWSSVLEASTFHLVVTDEGEGYTPKTPTEEDDLQLSERGRGLSIMREFTSAVSIAANEINIQFTLGDHVNG